jgi:ABC-type transport system involved in multi-copper enzyme maturation permease subunit
MGAGVSLALLYVKRGWDPLVIRIWPAILLIYLELAILTAVALLFSSFSSPALSALLTFFVFIAGHFSADLKTFAASLGGTAARWFFTGLYYLLPNFANYSQITPAAHGYAPGAATLLVALLYAMLYAGVVLAAGTLVFNQRNFK